MTAFSKRPIEINTARRFLIGCIDRPEDELPTYADVAATYGGIARAVGPVLNSIHRECELADAPDLTALVVDKATRLPGTFQGRPVTRGSAQEERWRAELDRIRGYDWSPWS